MNSWPTKKLGMVSDPEIKARVGIALGMLFKNDAFLLEQAAHERSIAHRLAEYLQQRFPDWHVDCEYNLHRLQVKKLPRECNNKYQEYVYPDIIIHHRNTNNNLLVIEIKPDKSSEVDNCDRTKLVEFTKQDGDYKYQLGLFISFDKLSEPQIIWFKDGQQKN